MNGVTMPSYRFSASVTMNARNDVDFMERVRAMHDRLTSMREIRSLSLTNNLDSRRVNMSFVFDSADPQTADLDSGRILLRALKAGDVWKGESNDPEPDDAEDVDRECDRYAKRQYMQLTPANE